MYDLISQLRRSKIKTQILRLIGDPKTPTDLKKILNLHRESVSRTLIQMQTQGLVKCITPSQPNYRYYQTTNKGKQLLKKLK
ncbi:MarR family transcriptional regulator [archaeon]|nr:MarR family transcriptional regulator [archaeon]